MKESLNSSEFFVHNPVGNIGSSNGKIDSAGDFFAEVGRTVSPPQVHARVMNEQLHRYLMHNKVRGAFSLDFLGEQLVSRIVNRNKLVHSHRLTVSRVELLESSEGSIVTANEDEVFLLFGNGTRFPATGAQDMKEGHASTNWWMNTQIDFSQPLSVNLREDDDGADPDDSLGSFTAQPKSAGERAVEVSGDGGRYRVTYRVEKNAAMAPTLLSIGGNRLTLLEGQDRYNRNAGNVNLPLKVNENFEFMVAPNGDLVTLEKRGSEKGTLIRILSHSSRYQKPVWEASIPLKADENWDFMIRPDGQLIAIHKLGPDKHALIHMLSPNDHYRTFTWQASVPLKADKHWDFMVRSDGQLIAIDKRGSDKDAHIHMLSPNDHYRTFTWQASVPLKADKHWDMMTQRNGDIVAIQKRNGGDAHIHILTASNHYRKLVWQASIPVKANHSWHFAMSR